MMRNFLWKGSKQLLSSPFSLQKPPSLLKASSSVGSLLSFSTTAHSSALCHPFRTDITSSRRFHSSSSRLNQSGTSAFLNAETTSFQNSSSNSTEGSHEKKESIFRTFISVLKKLLKWALILEVSLVSLIVLLYGSLKGFLVAMDFIDINNPSSRFYNDSEWAKSLFEMKQKCEGFHRYLNCSKTIYIIALDYFWLLITEPYNPHYWFVEKPDKNSEEFIQQKKEAHRRNAKRLLDMFMEQKGVYIKLGQFLSSLVSMIPDEYIETLAVLRDKAPQISFEDVKMVIHQDFGKPLEELFDEFEEKPIAAASIAQVHRARTKDGRLVAVKVQYPYVRAYFNGDMRTNDAMSTLSIKLYYMQEDAENIDTLVELNDKFNRELENGLLSELNFKHEAENAKKAAEHMQSRSDVYVPTVYDHLTSERVLTMEFIENACNANNVTKIKEMGFSDIDIAERILSVFSDQLFVHGFLHADPHSSNVFVRRSPTNPKEPQIVLLDHGLYKEFTEEFRLGYAKFVKSVVMNDEQGMKAYCDSLGVTDYKLYASLLMMQSYDSLDEGEKFDVDNWAEYEKILQEQKDEIINIYKSMPADMLFVGRADNILRGLNKDLGAKANRFTIMARSAAKGASLLKSNHGTVASERIGILATVNEWRMRMYFEMRLFYLSLQAWIMSLYVKLFGMTPQMMQLQKEHEKAELIEAEVDLLEAPKHLVADFK
ncbi:hypothetical protein C9374_002187 [Naegleria lovaniensis]|uniref:ABC1 atypical kinase-like domain-containing protein n=1 Tax=Naegleria lovaniensis TaxID=51637 RepID=A0AA88GUX5_NAELO|nr:uncharacterized protein C9374_002187 [Naegleria lovaniensis]KAG2386443.1 hypothetical protein C9374_002187 [Naegleria lovaniensis]